MKIHPLDEAFEIIEKLTRTLEEMESTLIKCNTELEMWREDFVLNPDLWMYAKDTQEIDYLKEKIRNAPAGIVNIGEFVEKELKCYRDTNRENT